MTLDSDLRIQSTVDSFKFYEFELPVLVMILIQMKHFFIENI